MRRRTWGLLCFGLGLIAMAGLMVGCGSSHNDAKVRMVNAMFDETGLDLLVDTKGAATGVAYGTASSYVGVKSGSHQLQTEASGGSIILIDRTDSFSSGSNMTLVCLNFSSNATSVLLTDDNSAPASGSFKLRIMNASPGLGPQDVYVVTAGSDINTISPTFSSLGYGSAADYLTLTAGDYQVIFTPEGSKQINIDSGVLTLASGQVRTVLALNNPVGGFMNTVLTDAN